MNWFNQLNLVPKNFIVANIVDVMKEDPENGVNKVYQLANDFIPDDKIKETITMIKAYYDEHPSVKLLIKNICYNTDKAVLNHTIQNLCVHTALDGHTKRQQQSQKYQLFIPPLLSLRVSNDRHHANVTTVHQWVEEGKELGIHLFILSGENQLYQSDYLDLYEKHKDVQFILITSPNEVLTLEKTSLQKLWNVLPVVTYENKTSSKTLEALTQLKKSNLLYGVTSSLTETTLKEIIANETTLSLIRHGARFNACAYQYEFQTLTKDQHQYVSQWANEIRQTKPYLPFMISQKQSGNFMLSIKLQERLFEYEVMQATPVEIKGSLYQFLKASTVK